MADILLRRRQMLLQSPVEREYFIKNGVFQKSHDSYPDQWGGGRGASPVVTEMQGYINIKHPTGSSDNGGIMSFGNYEGRTDFSAFTKLCVNYSANANNGVAYEQVGVHCLTALQNAWRWVDIYGLGLASEENVSKTSITGDISAVTGSAYVTIYVFGNQNTETNIYDLWLE